MLARTPCTVRISQVVAEDVAWLWAGRIPFGKLTLLDGDPGLGKSTLLLDLVARLSRGFPLPGGPVPRRLAKPIGTLLLSAEDGLADTIRPRLETAGADLDRVFALSRVPDSVGGGPISIPRDLHLIAGVAVRLQARLVVVDPLIAYLDPGLDANRDQAVRRALGPLAQYASQNGLAVVAVRHLSKLTSANPLYRGGGSIGLIGAARSALLVAQDPDDETGAARVVASTKSNLGPPPPALRFRLVQTGSVATVEWDGASPHSAASLLARAVADADRDPLHEARAILTSLLAAGPLPADQVQRQARQAGLGTSLIRRARAALGIRSRKLGRPGQAGQLWVWALPDPPALEDDAPAP